METRNYRRVTLRSSIKINVEQLADAPTLSFKLKRSAINPIINGLRRAASREISPESAQIRNLRSAKYSFGPRVRTIYSKFPIAERYVTGSVRDFHVTAN